MKIVVYPKDPNPYQDLLYSSIKDRHTTDKITFMSGPTKYQTINLFFLPFQLILYRLFGYDIFHIHWFYTFEIPKLNNRLTQWLMMYYCVSFVYFVKMLGFKLVWTVHETISPTALTDREKSISKYISQFTSIIADAKIIHSSVVINEMLDNGLNTDRTFIVPHGSYKNVYPDSITRKKAREELKIKSHEKMVLFFGLVRPYKGVDDLILAFSKLKLPNLRLVIAGKCIDNELLRRIQSLHNAVEFDFYDEYIADEDVSKYFKASDIVCLPFKSITTSGSTLLALSFGKPIIAPRLGALVDLPSNVGYLYDMQRPGSLETCLRKALKSNKHLSNIGKNSKSYVDTLSWDKIADKTYTVYEDVLK